MDIGVFLYTSTSGHWCIDVLPSISSRALDVMFTTEAMNKTQKENIACQLHRKFCHPSFDLLKKTLSVLDWCDDEFLQCLKNVSNKCKICKMYKPTNPRPVAGPLVDPNKMKFNEVVSLDIKVRKDGYILYMIDMVTRFTRATFLKNKDNIQL